MSTDDKTAIRAGWLQFLVTQLIAFLIYSLGLAYWMGGFSTTVHAQGETLSAQSTQLTVIDRRVTDMDKGFVANTQSNADHERRIRMLEDWMTRISPKIEVMADQVGRMDSKITILYDSRNKQQN
jgi:hypothetical protein